MDTLIIAEIGSVHDGSFGNACKLIETAAACGADAVKFQTHVAESETLKDAPMPHYFQGEPRYDYFLRTAFTMKEWKDLKSVCKKNQVLFLSSPFSLSAVDLLEEIGIEAYKIPSGEVTNLPLIEKIAKLKKPVILSSGMSDWKELDAAVQILDKNKLTVMQCSSAYPCPVEQVGLNIIGELRNRYQVRVGFSDHTLGFAASFAAATLGATMIEKHFTFSRFMYGSDAAHSMEPEEFKTFTSGLREIWNMLESPVNKNNLSSYREMKTVFEKSIVLRHDLPMGSILERNHLAFKKPGTGISASRYQEVIGRKLVRDVSGNTLLKESDLNMKACENEKS